MHVRLLASRFESQWSANDAQAVHTPPKATLPHPVAEHSRKLALQITARCPFTFAVFDKREVISNTTFTMSVSKCCTTGFEWDGEPVGHTVPFPTTSNQAYVTGSSSEAAILFICDLFGWEFCNNRLLADHLARSVGATVYVPDL